MAYGFGGLVLGILRDARQNNVMVFSVGFQNSGSCSSPDARKGFNSFRDAKPWLKFCRSRLGFQDVCLKSRVSTMFRI